MKTTSPTSAHAPAIAQKRQRRPATKNHQPDGQCSGVQRIAGVDGLRAPGDEVRQKDHQSRLGEFGGLQTDRTHAQPAMMCRVHEEYQPEQHQRQPDGGERYRRVLELLVVGALQEHHHQERRDHPQALAQNEVPGRSELELGDHGGSAI